MKKVKIIIEVELSEQEHVIDSTPNPLDHSLRLGIDMKDATLEEQMNLQHAQLLLDALRADPASYAEYVKCIIIGSLEGIEINKMIPSLANIECTYSAGLAVLESLLPKLPPNTQHHFKQAIQQGYISECTELVYNSFKACPISLAVNHQST
jgi:hypothetical protein